MKDIRESIEVPFLRSREQENFESDCPCTNLWFCVLRQAIVDIIGASTVKIFNDAQEWLTANREDFGSFYWACMLVYKDRGEIMYCEIVNLVSNLEYKPKPRPKPKPK